MNRLLGINIFGHQHEADNEIVLPANFTELSQVIKDRFNELRTTANKERLKQLIVASQDKNEIKGLLKRVFEWGIDQPHLTVSEVSSFVCDIIGLDKLENVLQTTDQETALIAASKRDKDILNWLPSGMVHNDLPVTTAGGISLLNIIPNTFNLFLDVFNFTDSSKNFTSLWEKYLIFEVMFRSIQLFYYVGQYVVTSLYPIILEGAAKVHVVALFIMAGVSLGALMYNRWYRDPFDIAGLINCSREWKNKLTVEKKECIEVSKSLRAGGNPILVGPSGSGKSSVIQHTFHMWQKGLLSANLNQTFLKVDNEELCVSNSRYNFKQHLLNFSKLGRAYPGKVIFVFDDLSTLLSLPEGYSAFYTFYKTAKETGLFQIIGALTAEEWKKLKEIDKSGVLTDNTMDLIEVKPESDKVLESYLWNTYHRHGSELLISEAAIKKIVQLCPKVSTSLVARPQKATDLLKKLIVEAKDSLATQEISQVYAKVIGYYRSNKLNDKAAELERRLEEEKELIKSIQINRQQKVDYQFRYVQMRENVEALQPNDKAQYLLANFFGMELLKKQMEEQVKILTEVRTKINKDMRLRGEPSQFMITDAMVKEYCEAHPLG